MKRARKILLGAGGVVSAGSAVVAGFSLPVLAGAALLLVAVIGIVCWTIADSRRSARLAMLISATRGQPITTATLELATTAQAPAEAQPGRAAIPGPPVQQ